MTASNVLTEELEAIKAIYGDDYLQIKTKSVWGRDSSTIVKLTLRANDNFGSEDSSIQLFISLPVDYPRNVPHLKIENVRNCCNEKCSELLDKLRNKASVLKGEQMIFELSSCAQEQLNVWQTNTIGEFKSLDDERMRRLQDQVASVQIAAENDLIKRNEHINKEKEALRQFVQMEQERKRRFEKVQQSIEKYSESSTHVRNHLPSVLHFEREIRIDNLSNNKTFDKISNLSRIFTGKQVQLYIGRPLVKEITRDLVAIKVIQLASEKWSSDKGRELLMALEVRLEEMREIRHDKLVSLYDYQVRSREAGGYYLFAVQRYCPRGSIRDLLEASGSLPYHVARLYAIDVLEALDALHSRNISHDSIHCGNVLVDKISSRPFALLSDFGIADFLVQMSREITEGQIVLTNLTKNLPKLWQPPEYMDEQTSDNSIIRRQKLDIWYFGIVFLQLLYGLDVPSRFNSPQECVLQDENISKSVSTFLEQVFTKDFMKRPNTGQLLTSHFVRLGQYTNKEQNSDSSQASTSYISSVAGAATNNAFESRWKFDFEAVDTIGQGGFGEVIKARNKLDGRIYAVKKIPLLQDERANGRILREVVTLSRLSHEYIVRYYTTWVEKVSTTDSYVPELSEEEEETAEIAYDLSTEPQISGIDIHFSSENFTSGEKNVDNNLRNGKISGLFTQSAKPRAIIYIQMEYCEGKTLKDLIHSPLNDTERWRLFRQILEALKYIHSQGMIHRDLKPTNIFLDENLNVKIGDFGLSILAGSSFTLSATSNMSMKSENPELTSGIGTLLYVAPEIISNRKLIPYDQKVDMYSLGIIFFELWHFFETEMERVKVLSSIRTPNIDFTRFPGFPLSSRQLTIVSNLLDKEPKNRFSSSELLSNNLLPDEIEDQSLKLSLKILNDPRSHFRQEVLSILFSSTSDKFSEALFENSLKPQDESMLKIYQFVNQIIFRLMYKHGAVQRDESVIFPLSTIYGDIERKFSIIDRFGHHLQLPYDLTVPFARDLIKNDRIPRKSFAFGKVFRHDPFSDGPRIMHEVQFAIIKIQELHEILDEAETLILVDEILSYFCESSETTIAINNVDIIREIRDFCKIDESKEARFCSIIANLTYQSWAQVKNRLRAQSIIPSSSVEILKQFNFFCPVEDLKEKLSEIPGFSSRLDRIKPALQKLLQVDDLLRNLNIKSKVKFNPLLVTAYELYIMQEKGNIIFQGLKGILSFDLLCAGGRITSLFHRVDSISNSDEQKKLSAVTFSFALDKIASLLFAQQDRTERRKAGYFLPYNPYLGQFRNDILIGRVGRIDLKTLLKLCSELWNCDIRADYYPKSMINIDDLVNISRSQGFKSALTIKPRNPISDELIKFKSVDMQNEYEMPKQTFISWIKTEWVEDLKSDRSNWKSRQTQSSISGSLSSIEFISFNTSRKDIDKRRKKGTFKQNATFRVQELMQNFHDKFSRIPIFATDLDEANLRKLASSTLEEQSWREFLDQLSAIQRRSGFELREQLKCLRDQGKFWAFICSFKCNQIVLFSLIHED